MTIVQVFFALCSMNTILHSTSVEGDIFLISFTLMHGVGDFHTLLWLQKCKSHCQLVQSIFLVTSMFHESIFQIIVGR